MKTDYKLLGDYIRQVDERNKDLSITKLNGVSINKKFIPSIANIIGTDLSNYKIVRTGQFAYGPVTSRNGDKISVAYLVDEDCIISSSYTVFEVTRKNELDPEYLMLWFCRPEFDRYARYRSHGSVREIFDWEEMCMVEIPVPDMEEQRRIVKAYKAITDRIALKEQINDNLEAHLSTLFTEYIINDAAFEFDEALDDNIEFINGLAMQNFRPDDNQLSLPVIKIRELSQGFCDDNSELCKPKIEEEHIINVGDIVFSWSGTLQVSFWAAQKAGLNQHLFKVASSKYPAWFIYLWITYYLLSFQRIAKNKGTTFGHIKREDLHNSKIKSLNHKRIIELNNVFSPIINLKIENACEKQSLIKVQTFFLAKLGC